jgi:multicomponent Na+:H+ antiporter subunit E
VTRKWPAIGGLLAVLWLFVSGVDLTVSGVVGGLVVGLAVGMPVAFATRRLYTSDTDFARMLVALPAAVKYLVLFLYELLTANVDVAYRVLDPRLPIDPDVVEVPLRVESDAAITTIANSITLTPGTLTMDYDDETNTIYVHALTGRSDYRSVVDPIRAWEDLALVIFNERLDPEDSPERPRPTAHGGAAGAGGAGGADPGDGSERARGGERRGD